MSEFNNAGSLGIEAKQDHPQRVKELAGTDTKYYFSAEELDKMRRATEELHKLKATKDELVAAADGFLLFANEAAANSFFTDNPPVKNILFRYTDQGASKADFYRRASDNTTQLLKEAGLTEQDKSQNGAVQGGSKLITEGQLYTTDQKIEEATKVVKSIIAVPSSSSNSYIRQDGQGPSGTGWYRTSTLNTALMYEKVENRSYFYTGEIASGVSFPAGVVFYDAEGDLIGFQISEVGVYEDEEILFPENTVFFAACSYGANAQIKEGSRKLKNSELEIPVASSERVDSIELAVVEAGNTANDVHALFTIEKYFDFKKNAEVLLKQNYVISQTGDYIEWIGRNNEVKSSIENYQSLYLFGEKGEVTDTCGYYTNSQGVESIRIRGASGNYVDLDGGQVNYQEFNKFRIELNGTDWKLYVNDTLTDTQPIDASGVFTVRYIGDAGSNAVKSNVSLKYLVLKSSANLTTITDFKEDELIDNETNVSFINNSKLKASAKPIEEAKCYYTIDLDGSDSGNEVIFVYSRIKDNFFCRTKIAHFVNATGAIVSGIRPYTDLWRHNGAVEVELVNDEFVLTGNTLVYSSENEYAYHVEGAGDHTGGWHGYEELQRVHFFADGLPVAFDAEIATPVPCNSFYYAQYSTCYVHNEYPRISSEHGKITDFTKAGYRTKNVILFKQDFAQELYNGNPKEIQAYAGLSCVGLAVSQKYYVDDYDLKSTIKDGNPYTLKQGGDSTLYYNNTNTGLSATVKADILNCVVSDQETAGDSNRRLETILFDRTTDAKYYRRNYGFLFNDGDYLVAELEMKITKA
ncbi:MAG: hypothetical protein VYB38_14320 [Bacteroidota bacterium]|nr:hypothetical protein [Bacteroidota bacterium]